MPLSLLQRSQCAGQSEPEPESERPSPSPSHSFLWPPTAQFRGSTRPRNMPRTTRCDEQAHNSAARAAIAAPRSLHYGASHRELSVSRKCTNNAVCTLSKAFTADGRYRRCTSVTTVYATASMKPYDHASSTATQRLPSGHRLRRTSARLTIAAAMVAKRVAAGE